MLRDEVAFQPSTLEQRLVLELLSLFLSVLSLCRSSTLLAFFANAKLHGGHLPSKSKFGFSNARPFAHFGAICLAVVDRRESSRVSYPTKAMRLGTVHLLVTNHEADRLFYRSRRPCSAVASSISPGFARVPTLE